MKIIAVFLISLNLAGCWFSRENCAMDCGRSPYTFEYGTGQFVCSIGKAKVFPFFYLDYNCEPEEMKIYYIDFYPQYEKYFLSDKECFSVCSNYLTPQKSAETMALEMSGMDAGNSGELKKIRCFTDELLRYNAADLAQSEVLGACGNRTVGECAGKWKFWKEGFCSCALKLQMNYNQIQIIELRKGPIHKKCF